MVKRSLIASLAWAMLALSGTANGQESRPSPPGNAEVELKGQTVSVAYSRPSMRGRKIMGELVPYGEVWRTGANEATQLTTPLALEIGGVEVPAGKYSLFTLPSEGVWMLIINKETGQSGLDYSKEQDLARIDMKKTKTAAPVEKFTISWEKKGNESGLLVLEWENTRLTVPVRAK